MVENTKVCGKGIKWKVRAFFSGLISESTKVIMLLIKRKALEYSSGNVNKYIFT